MENGIFENQKENENATDANGQENVNQTDRKDQSDELAQDQSDTTEDSYAKEKGDDEHSFKTTGTSGGNDEKKDNTHENARAVRENDRSEARNRIAAGVHC